MSEKAIYFDSSKCTACKGCQVACKCWNNLPSPLGTNETKWSGTHQNPADINGNTRLIITFNELAGDSKIKPVKWAFGRRACQHCTDAPCATVCPGGALVRNEDTGFVEVHQDKCVGCQYCHSVCPFDVPRLNPEDNRVYKCTLCVDRVSVGQEPACVKTCPTGAIHFGTKKEMLDVAQARVDKLKARGYENAGIYNPQGVGGTHVMYVLHHNDQPELYHNLPKDPAIDTSINLWKGALKPLSAAGFIATFAGLIYHYIGIGPNKEVDEDEEEHHE